MATTIDSYSTELNQHAPGSPQLYAPVKPNQHRGKVRMSSFTHVYASEVAGEDTALAIIPKGARLLGGKAAVSATTGSTTLAYGLMGADGNGFIDDTVGATVADGVALLKAAAAQTTTATVDLCATVALKLLYETKKELFVTVTTATATIGTPTLSGYIMYVVE